MHQAVFVDGTTHLLNWLGDTATRHFTSSTSVYPQTDGNWVTKQPTTMALPAPPLTFYRLKLYFKRALELATILRVAGIYGPERGYLYRQFLKDEAVITRLARAGSI